MKKLKSRMLAVSVLYAFFGLATQLLLPRSLSAQEHQDAGLQPGPVTTAEERFEQRLQELEKARIRYEAAIREQEHLRQRVEELEREKAAHQYATREHERLRRRLEELETTTVAHEDATRTIIRQSLSTLGSKVNEFVTLGGTFEMTTGWASPLRSTRVFWSWLTMPLWPFR